MAHLSRLAPCHDAMAGSLSKTTGASGKQPVARVGIRNDWTVRHEQGGQRVSRDEREMTHSGAVISANLGERAETES